MSQRRDDALVEKLLPDFYHRDGPPLEARSNGVHMPATLDMYPRDNEWGIMSRLDVTPDLDWKETASGDHFDGVFPTIFSWAGAPFVTPNTINLAGYQSILNVAHNLGAAWRAFLYKSVAPTPGGFVFVGFMGAMEAIGTTPFTNGAWFAYRIDDGSDNNYVEAGYVTNLTTYGGVANHYHHNMGVKFRTGGGAVTTVTMQPLNQPVPLLVRCSISGTTWTNWNHTCFLRGISSAWRHTHWSPNSYPTGLTWTPSRAGIVFESFTTATWFNWFLDAMYVSAT